MPRRFEQLDCHHRRNSKCKLTVINRHNLHTSLIIIDRHYRHNLHVCNLTVTTVKLQVNHPQPSQRTYTIDGQIEDQRRLNFEYVYSSNNSSRIGNDLFKKTLQLFRSRLD